MAKILTHQMFKDTLLEFYGKMGNRDFWESMKAQEVAIDALGQDYIRAGEPEDATSLQAALLEYEMRKSWCPLPGTKKGVKARRSKMEAKDTVMSNLVWAVAAHPDLPMGQAIALEQAEVSFKAGEAQGKMDFLLKQSPIILEAKQAGIKEVVEWVEKTAPGAYRMRTDWQAKLKEWGVAKE